MSRVSDVVAATAGPPNAGGVRAPRTPPQVPCEAAVVVPL
jgi:hypothetical protein